MQLLYRNAVRPISAAASAACLLLALPLAQAAKPVSAAGSPPEETFQSVHVFSNDASRESGGAKPSGPMVQAQDGMFYGVSAAGGKYGLGALYRMAPDGTTATLVSFSAKTGTVPAGPLTLGRDGNLYGVTTAGGNCDVCGTIFRLSKSGKFKVLHRMDSAEDGATPNGGLLQAADGGFYGTASGGGVWNRGTVFHLASDGAVTREHSFYGATGAYAPRAGLILASDGGMYGTADGGMGGWGAVYRFQPGLGITWEGSLSRSTGTAPAGRLVQGPDGYLYGTARLNGPAADSWPLFGTVYRVLPPGEIESFVAFDGTGGKTPQGGLTLGADGNFYGTTYEGGFANMGTLFRLTPSRQLSVMHTFRAGDGGHPLDPPVQGQDGWLQGTTTTGGSVDDVGTAYKAAP